MGDTTGIPTDASNDEIRQFVSNAVFYRGQLESAFFEIETKDAITIERPDEHYDDMYALVILPNLDKAYTVYLKDWDDTPHSKSPERAYSAAKFFEVEAEQADDEPAFDVGAEAEKLAESVEE